MITIREAQQEDAGQIAPLINLIFDEMQLEELEDVPEPDLEQVIAMAYRTRSYLSGDATTVVAEADGQVVGVAFGYPGQNEHGSTKSFVACQPKVPPLTHRLKRSQRRQRVNGTWIPLPFHHTIKDTGSANAYLRHCQPTPTATTKT